VEYRPLEPKISLTLEENVDRSNAPTEIRNRQLSHPAPLTDDGDDDDDNNNSKYLTE
jgi:hypothetical protein